MSNWDSLMLSQWSVITTVTTTIATHFKIAYVGLLDGIDALLLFRQNQSSMVGLTLVVRVAIVCSNRRSPVIFEQTKYGRLSQRVSTRISECYCCIKLFQSSNQEASAYFAPKWKEKITAKYIECKFLKRKWIHKKTWSIIRYFSKWKIFKPFCWKTTGFNFIRTSHAVYAHPLSLPPTSISQYPSGINCISRKESHGASEESRLFWRDKWSAPVFAYAHARGYVPGGRTHSPYYPRLRPRPTSHAR